MFIVKNIEIRIKPIDTVSIVDFEKVESLTFALLTHIRQMLHSHSVALAWYGLTLLVPISQNGQTHQTIRRKLPTNCLSVFDHFVGLALKCLNVDLTLILLSNPRSISLLCTQFCFDGLLSVYREFIAHFFIFI